MVNMSLHRFSACLSVMLSWSSVVVSSTIVRFLAAVMTMSSGISFGAVMNLWWKLTASEM